MKNPLLVLGLLVTACSSEKPAENRSVTVNRPPASTDEDVYSDSALGRIRGDEEILTAQGDTFQLIAGSILRVDSAQEYLVDEYRKNETHYLRVARMIGHTHDGMPIQVTRARIALPIRDSSEELILQGLCRIDGKQDPLVLAIAVIPDGSIFGPSRHAWRFDPVTEKLSEIPIQGVTCAHVVGED